MTKSPTPQLDREVATTQELTAPPPKTPIDWRAIFAGAVFSAAAGALVKWALRHPDMQGKGSPRDGKAA